MKLAEALSFRKDLEKKISGLKERLENVVLHILSSRDCLALKYLGNE